MALSSKLFTEESPGRIPLQRCADSQAGRFIRGMTSTPEIKDAVTRIQKALAQLGFKVSDPTGVYGATTEAAVLKFKGPPRNILFPGQTKPDGVVGVQTIHRLDQEISNGTPKPAPAPATGSSNWRFSFFGNRGLLGPGIYNLTIGSLDAPESKDFVMDEITTFGDLIGGFRGSTRGTFQTPNKMSVKEFSGSPSQLFIQKQGKFLNGNLQLSIPGDKGIVSLKFALFEEERVLGGSLTSGTFLVHGRTRLRT